MAVTSTLSNHFKYQLASGNIDFDADTFKIMLISGEAFDKDAHATWNDLSDREISAGGYTASGEEMAGVSLTEDDSNDKAYVTWSNVTWTASGESIVAEAAVIVDDTTSDDTIVGAVEFGEQAEATDGNNLVVQSLQIDLS